MKIKIFLLAILAFGSKQRETVDENGTAYGEFSKRNSEKPIVVKIEGDEYVKVSKRRTSEYFGVFYEKKQINMESLQMEKN
jgi:hypothetical protein